MADILKVDLVALPTSSVFEGHAYLQHANAEHMGTNNMRYHAFLFPDDVKLQDSIVFAYK